MVDLAGARMLPGLIDAHIHPLALVDVDSCDLTSQAKSLAGISELVKACVTGLHLASASG